MAANVTISHLAWSDPRIRYLAELTGYTFTDVMGRLAMLWSRCTELQTDRPGRIEIRACMGPRGDQLLLDAGLAEEIGSDLRVKGCDGRIDWYGGMATKRANGGKARTSTAKRDARGRMLGNAGPASSPASDQCWVQQSSKNDIAGPASPAHSSRSESDPRSEDPEREAPAEITTAPQPPDSPKPRDLSREVSAGTAEILAARGLGERGFASLNAIRVRLAHKFGWQDVRPLHPFDRSRTDLAERLRESGERAEADMLHVLRIAELEAVRKQTPQYLGGGIFSKNSWDKKLAMREADVGGKSGSEPQRIRVKRDDGDDMPPLGPEGKR